VNFKVGTSPLLLAKLVGILLDHVVKAAMLLFGRRHDSLDIIDVNHGPVHASSGSLARNLVRFRLCKVKVRHDPVASQSSSVSTRVWVKAGTDFDIVKAFERFRGMTNEALL